MAISDKDRKLLWGRSHNRCAYCQQPLSVEARPQDRAAIVGDEAHIISGAPNGPRSGEPLSCGIDAYENLILLCRTHHKMVDDQPNEFTALRLLTMKAEHEAWAEGHFGTDNTEKEHHRSVLVDSDDAKSIPFHIVDSGVDLWNMASSSFSFGFSYGDEDKLLDQQQEAIDALYQDIKEYGDVHGEVEDIGHTAIRDAKRQLAARLAEVHDLNLIVYARTIRRLLTGGRGSDQAWLQSEFHTVPVSSIVSFPDEETESTA